MSNCLTYSIIQQRNINFIPDSLNDDLVFIYELDETEGNVAIDSKGNYNATNLNATINIDGKISKCYSFYDINAHIFTPLIPDPSGNPYSIGLWMYPTEDYNQNTRLFSKRHKYPLLDDTSSGFEIDYNSHTGVIRGFNVAKGITSTTVSIKLNKWIHIVLVYDSINLHLYVNGSLKNSVSSGYVSNSEVCVIGNVFYSGAINYNFRGKIDQVFMYSRALVKKEISAIYGLGKGLAYSNW